MLASLATAFQAAGLSVFLFGSALLAVTDLRTQLIPSRWLYPCLWGTGSSLAGAAVVDSAWCRLAEALVSAAVAMAVFLLFHQFSSLGMGDVRLVGLVSLFLGWFSPVTAVVGLVLGFLVGGLVAAMLLALRRGRRHTMLPFGPCLVVGSWVALLRVLCRAM